jgi:hypothetical protein
MQTQAPFHPATIDTTALDVFLTAGETEGDELIVFPPHLIPTFRVLDLLGYTGERFRTVARSLIEGTSLAALRQAGLIDPRDIRAVDATLPTEQRMGLMREQRYRAVPD